MGSVYPKQGKWWIKYRDVTGKTKNVPTKSDTKTAAKRLLRELEQKIERQRHGLEPMPVVEIVTFGELMTKWWKEHEPLLRSKTIQPFAEKHLRAPLGDKPLGEISVGMLEELFNRLLTELSPQSCLHLRSYISKLYRYAARRDLWRGANPASSLRKFKVPKKKPEYLRPVEIARVLDELDDRWRPLFVTAFFTGMRKGELLALKKSDVDLVTGTITVRRSNNFDTTKGSHEDELPIANGLRSVLARAISDSSSELVFPRADGRQYPPDLALAKVFRRAMARAGVVVGFEHVCRRKGCGFRERRDHGAASLCPRCAMKLWVKPIPKPLRFHDTRHSTAALLLRAKVPLVIVQKVLRHSDPAITANIYGNIGSDDLREAVNILGDSVRPHLKLVAGGEVIDAQPERESES